MANKAAAPSVGNVYADRDPRRKGRRVKVVKVVRSERKAICENTKTGKKTRIAYNVLEARFSRV